MRAGDNTRLRGKSDGRCGADGVNVARLQAVASPQDAFKIRQVASLQGSLEDVPAQTVDVDDDHRAPEWMILFLTSCGSPFSPRAQSMHLYHTVGFRMR